MTVTIEEHLITPALCSNPNIAAGTASLPIHPISLWPVGAIPSVLVFPGTLDIARLKNGIAQIAAIWPNICGRYVKKPRTGSAGEWDFAVRPLHLQ